MSKYIPPVETKESTWEEPKNTWVRYSPDDKSTKPPFNVYVLFETEQRIVYWGYRSSNKFTGALVLNGQVNVIEVEETQVLSWFSPVDPPLLVLPTSQLPQLNN